MLAVSLCCAVLPLSTRGNHGRELGRGGVKPPPGVGLTPRGGRVSVAAAIGCVVTWSSFRLDRLLPSTPVGWCSGAPPAAAPHVLFGASERYIQGTVSPPLLLDTLS